MVGVLQFLSIRCGVNLVKNLTMGIQKQVSRRNGEVGVEVSEMKRLLVAFDFDHTIIDENSDLVARNLVPSEKIPADVKLLYRSDGWTAYMQRIFELLHSNGITPQEIQSAVKDIPVTLGFDKLLKFLNSNGAEIIIISDSNSEFIEGWLTGASLKHTVSEVFTNPAQYNCKGCLEIQMYHCQDWCKLSTKNLCKGHILETYIKERAKQGVEFSKVAYVGDGKNDLCPILRLTENDLAFPRLHCPLMNAINECNGTDAGLKATPYPWATGDDIMKVICEHI